MTHICVSDLIIIGSDIRSNAGILLIRPLRTNFSEILNEILIFSFKKMPMKVSAAKRWPFCLGLNVLTPLNRSANRITTGSPFRRMAYCLSAPNHYLSQYWLDVCWTRLGQQEQTSVKLETISTNIFCQESAAECRLQSVGHVAEALMCQHWSGNVVIVTKFSPLPALKVINQTSGAATDEEFVQMTTFPFPWMAITPLPLICWCVPLVFCWGDRWGIVEGCRHHYTRRSCRWRKPVSR